MPSTKQNYNTHVKDLVAQISPLLETVSEALAFLSKNDDEELKLGVTETRGIVTGLIEKSLNCSLEKTLSISSLSDEDWLITTRHILDEMLSPFSIQNYYDAQFICLIKQALKNSEDTLLENLKLKLQEFSKRYPKNYEEFVAYFSTFPFWGTLRPEADDFVAFERRVAVIKRHAYDLIWLYRRLEDYTSKCTLIAILDNWLNMELESPMVMRSRFSDYWEPDIFPNNKDDVLVDVGAFTGDSIRQYIETYGQFYKKINAYEISPKSIEELHKAVVLNGWHDVLIRQKGAGSSHRTMFLNEAENTSSNTVSTKESNVSVDIVPLDDEIGEEATFIKMDIEGAEQDALLGLEKTISARHPKLAVCTYHGYEDIWKIPVMIDKMYPGYKFYFRHYGGNMPPTEFVLLCK